MFLGPCPSRRHFSDKSRAKVLEELLASSLQQRKSAGVTGGCLHISYGGSAWAAPLAGSDWGVNAALLVCLLLPSGLILPRIVL